MAKQKPSGVYIELFHGRMDPKAEMADWGDAGPVIGPFEYVHMTYKSDYKVETLDGLEDRQSFVEDGLFYFDGVYYGDISIISADKVLRTPELKARIAPYDTRLASPPDHTPIKPPAGTVSELIAKLVDMGDPSLSVFMQTDQGTSQAAMVGDVRVVPFAATVGGFKAASNGEAVLISPAKL